VGLKINSDKFGTKGLGLGWNRELASDYVSGTKDLLSTPLKLQALLVTNNNGSRDKNLGAQLIII
jgi:hypothetical protein